MEKTKMPYCLHYILIENYSIFERVEVAAIPANTRCILVRGNSHKETFLKAVVTAIKGCKCDYAIKSKILYSDHTAIKKTTYTRELVTENGIEGFIVKSPDNEIPIVALGCERLQMRISSKKHHTAINHLFDFRGMFDFDYYLRLLLNIYNSKDYENKSMRNYLNQFEIFKEIIYSTTKVREIGISSDYETALYTIGKNQYDFDSLPRETKAVLNLIFDILAKLGNNGLPDNQMEANILQPNELGGIVIIDLIEQYLPKESVAALITNLMRIFSKVQFIISTNERNVFVPDVGEFFIIDTDSILHA